MELQKSCLRHMGTLHCESSARAYPSLKAIRYERSNLDLDEALDGADLVIVHEWNDHELVRADGKTSSAQSAVTGCCFMIRIIAWSRTRRAWPLTTLATTTECWPMAKYCRNFTSAVDASSGSGRGTKEPTRGFFIRSRARRWQETWYGLETGVTASGRRRSRNFWCNRSRRFR